MSYNSTSEQENYGLIDLLGSGVDLVEDVVTYPYEAVKNFITGDYPDRVSAKEVYDTMGSFTLENGTPSENNPDLIQFQGKQWNLTFDKENSLLTINRIDDNSVLFQGDSNTLFAYNANEKEMELVEVIDKYMELEEEQTYGADLELE